MKLFILNPSADINSLCASMLSEECFHTSLTVVQSDKSKKSYFAWEVTRLELQTLLRSFNEKGISQKHVRIAIFRTRTSESLRIAQKKEYLLGYQSQNKRPERLKKIIAERKNKLL